MKDRDMSSDRDGSSMIGGFHSYADDTPRDEASHEPPLKAQWAEVPAWRQVDPPEAEPPAWPRATMVAGAIVAVAVGSGLAWNAQRDAPSPPQAPKPPALAVAPPLEIVIADPPPSPPVASADRLEVLPSPASGRSAARPAPAPLAAAPLAQTPVAQRPLASVVIPAPRSAPPPVAPNAPTTSVQASTRAEPLTRRFDDCDDAPTRAYAMVCRDMRLAEADRRMKRAYQAALASGVRPDMLRHDQDDWLEVREEAAQVSRQAVADIYRQRTRELLGMADRRD